ncbi:MAG: hypothetical protein KDB14_25895 [Planctomycetales bacterium]|nr:hypothetical protein [Planctomycetales bacterium]
MNEPKALARKANAPCSVELELLAPQATYHPGDEIRFRYRVQIAEEDSVSAVEVSVLWHTEGKGDEDLGVHFFERRTPDSTENVSGPATLTVVLPNTPLSYDGRIVKIRWYVRVRAFPRKGRSFYQEAPFRLLSRRHAGGFRPRLVSPGGREA